MSQFEIEAGKESEHLSGIERMAIIGGWLPGRILIVLYAYFDESGEHNPDGSLNRLTIGGFIAPWSEVEQLCIEWRAAQAEHAMGEFHMKEFASDEHDFWSWPPERQKRLNDFVHILCKRAERFCARTYKVTNGKKALKDTYETALAGIVPKLGTIAEERGETIEVFFAHHPEIQSELIGRYFDLINWDACRLSEYSIRDARREPALQSAEIVARGLMRKVQDGLITHSFEQVLGAGKPVDCWPTLPKRFSR